MCYDTGSNTAPNSECTKGIGAPATLDNLLKNIEKMEKAWGDFPYKGENMTMGYGFKSERSGLSISEDERNRLKKKFLSVQAYKDGEHQSISGEITIDVVDDEMLDFYVKNRLGCQVQMTYNAIKTLLWDIKYVPPIDNVIFNDPATIVFWNDGSKTVVKCQEGDTFSKETGLAMAIAKKALGNKGRFNETFKQWIPEYGKSDD